MWTFGVSFKSQFKSNWSQGRATEMDKSCPSASPLQNTWFFPKNLGITLNESIGSTNKSFGVLA